MAEVIRMPKMSDTMEQGVIATWLKKEGDEISSGDILAEVETDKATMELESYQDGILLHIGAEEKESVPVDGILAVIGEKGEEYSHLFDRDSSPLQTESAASAETSNIDTSNINAKIIRMPKMSDTMEEGVIASWLKKVGDQVESGDILAEVKTDKATMELEAYEEGTLLYTAGEAGKGVPVNDIIAIVGEKGADFEALLAKKAPVASASQETPASSPAPSPVPSSTPVFIQPSNDGRVKASPLAKKIAAEKGIDLSVVGGTGESGRIVKRDVENFQPSPGKALPATDTPTIHMPVVAVEEHSERVGNSQMRKTIARRLSESKFNAPHFYLTMEINMDNAIEARKSINEVAPAKISFNDIIIKATAAALRQHPDVNVTWTDDYVMKHQHIHMGVAVAIPDGLIVPVVRFADNKSLTHISIEVKELGTKAREKKLRPEEFSGNTFTISNLGMFGIEEFTAIINPPDACIMAVGSIKETVIVKNGEMRPGNVMKVTLSCDHRAVDGAIGSAFLKTFKNLLEDPVRILI